MGELLESRGHGLRLCFVLAGTVGPVQQCLVDDLFPSLPKVISGEE